MVLELPYATVKTETRHLPTTQWSHLSSRVVEVRASPPKRLRGGWNEPRPTVRSDPTKALRAKRPRIQNCSLPKHLRSALFPFQMEPTRFRRRQTQRRRCGRFLAKVVAIEEPKRRKCHGLVLPTPGSCARHFSTSKWNPLASDVDKPSAEGAAVF